MEKLDTVTNFEHLETVVPDEGINFVKFSGLVMFCYKQFSDWGVTAYHKILVPQNI